MEASLWIALLLAVVSWPLAGWLVYRRLELRLVVVALAVATALFAITLLAIRQEYQAFFGRFETLIVNGQLPPPASLSSAGPALVVLWLNVLAFLVMTWTAYALVIDLYHAVFGERA